MGTTGEAKHSDWIIWERGGTGWERRRLREEEAAAAARNDKECMNKSQERWRERTRRTRDGKREEKERQAQGTRTGTSGEAMHPDWNIRGAEALDWNVLGSSVS